MKVRNGPSQLPLLQLYLQKQTKVNFNLTKNLKKKTLKNVFPETIKGTKWSIHCRNLHVTSGFSAHDFLSFSLPISQNQSILASRRRESFLYQRKVYLKSSRNFHTSMISPFVEGKRKNSGSNTTLKDTVGKRETSFIAQQTDIDKNANSSDVNDLEKQTPMPKHLVSR